MVKIADNQPVLENTVDLEDYMEELLEERFAHELSIQHLGRTIQPRFTVNTSIQGIHIMYTVSVNLVKIAPESPLVKLTAAEKLPSFVLGEILRIRLFNFVSAHRGQIEEAIKLSADKDWAIELEELQGKYTFNPTKAQPFTDIDKLVATHLDASNICVGDYTSNLHATLYTQGPVIFIDLYNHAVQVYKPFPLCTITQLNATKNTEEETVPYLVEVVLEKLQQDIAYSMDQYIQEEKQEYRSEMAYRNHLKYA